jgi:FMN phosphatase YigB (HAD superfamily)
LSPRFPLSSSHRQPTSTHSKPPDRESFQAALAQLGVQPDELSPEVSF